MEWMWRSRGDAHQHGHAFILCAHKFIRIIAMEIGIAFHIFFWACRRKCSNQLVLILGRRLLWMGQLLMDFKKMAFRKTNRHVVFFEEQYRNCSHWFTGQLRDIQFNQLRMIRRSKSYYYFFQCVRFMYEVLFGNDVLHVNAVLHRPKGKAGPPGVLLTRHRTTSWHFSIKFITN